MKKNTLINLNLEISDSDAIFDLDNPFSPVPILGDFDDENPQVGMNIKMSKNSTL